MALISPPGTDTVDRFEGGRAGGRLVEMNAGWRNFFTSVFNICNALTQSGTTAQRPATLLWTGRVFFDTTLGKPIWWKTVGWVDAAGVAA